VSSGFHGEVNLDAGEIWASEVLPHGVAKVEAFHDFGDTGAAALLSEVGSEVPKAAWAQLFQTLGALHEGGIVHGDPRLSNAIFVHGAVKWIDFRSSVVAMSTVSTQMKRRDLSILVKSCCDEQNIVAATTATEVALHQYDGTVASAMVVYETFSSN